MAKDNTRKLPVMMMVQKLTATEYNLDLRKIVCGCYSPTYKEEEESWLDVKLNED